MSHMQDKSGYRRRVRLGEFISAWRNEKRLTVRAAGEKFGVQYATLNRLERGENPDGRTLAKILRFLLEEV